MQIQSVKQFVKIVSALNLARTSDIKLPFWNGACYMANVEAVESFEENFGTSQLHVLKTRIRIELQPQYMCRLLYDVGQGYLNNMEGWHFAFNYEGLYFDSHEYKMLGYEPVCGVLAVTFELRIDYFYQVPKENE